jgi:hypothetical protein
MKEGCIGIEHRHKPYRPSESKEKRIFFFSSQTNRPPQEGFFSVVRRPAKLNPMLFKRSYVLFLWKVENSLCGAISFSCCFLICRKAMLAA